MPAIGPIQLPIPFCQAGLAGYSDRAMRLVARRRGCPYAVTEALLDVILLSGGKGLRNSIDIDAEDHPTAGQVIGSDPDAMARAARIVADFGYDVVDLNFACPVKKIKNKARGGHMLQDLPRGTDILKAARDAVPPTVPMTVSLRRGFDDSPASVDRFFELIETAWSHGYVAVRVHARTVTQIYQGRADWTFLRDLKRRYPDKAILGSGDVFTAEDAVRMFTETGVDVVWIARGAIGNPWIFGHAAALLNAKEPRTGGTFAVSGVATSPLTAGVPSVRGSLTVAPITPPTLHEQRAALTEHFAIAMQIHGESLAGRRMRKMGIKYSRFHPDAATVKREFIEVHSLRDWTAVLDRHYAADAPGVWPASTAADEVNCGDMVPVTATA
jgi:nifR3 family TIM-barrel protein